MLAYDSTFNDTGDPDGRSAGIASSVSASAAPGPGTNIDIFTPKRGCGIASEGTIEDTGEGDRTIAGIGSRRAVESE